MASLRAAVTGALAAVLLVVGSSAASADPAGPTAYRSQVTAVEPAVDGLEVEVIGGDAYVQLTAPAGATVTVPGYRDGDVYLRFLPDGTVERNAASPARWINDARYGAEVPPAASADAPPRWETVATGGTYAWHDHRVHWMSPVLPGQVDPGLDEPQRVQTWSLQLAVDDRPVEVVGVLDHLPSPSPVAPAAAALLALGVGLLVATRMPPAVPLVAAAGALAAAVVGAASVVSLPPGAETDPTMLVLPAVALVLVVVAVAIRGRPGIAPRVIGGLAGLPLVVWGASQVGALTRAVVPTALPDGIARLLVAVVFGTAVAALLAAGRAVVVPPPGPSPS
jgi:hypothetical protein